MTDSTLQTRWFREARYGMFFHWGIYSLLGRGEQVLLRDHLVPSEYRKLAQRFRPQPGFAQRWAAVAKAAGMRYAVLTTKHCDGFCLFDTATTGHSAMQGAGRDLVAEYVRAFRRAGLRVGLYFSLADWNTPAYFEGPERNPAGFNAFIRMVHEQVRELCSNYGRIDILWFDGGHPYHVHEWQSARMERMIRRLQPGILINDRLDTDTRHRGDFTTSEQFFLPAGRPWEYCLTSTARWWGWHPGDNLWKSPREIISVLCRSAAWGGNTLLNVGPKADGSLPLAFVRRAKRVGAWLRANGEAIYGTGPALFDTKSIASMTVRRNRVYLLVLYWPGSEIQLCGLKGRIRTAEFLATRRPIRVERKGERFILRDLPRKAPDPCCTVIRLTVGGTPERHPWAAIGFWTRDDVVRQSDWARQ